ncbi:MAG: tetratricopeptide repeat protein [Acidobacteriota bacterium]|nr:tetratricopeptide repeat protein [Acidobacteriota bacterium]
MCAVLLLFAGVSLALPQASSSIDQKAATDFQEGRVADAESALESVLRAHPQDLSALSLMAVILDSQRKYSEAEAFYRRALQIAPSSTALLNNLGNHYLATGNPKKAEESFGRVVAIDPHHLNANLQLADMNVQRKEGAEALACLSRLAANAQSQPVAQLLKAQALVLIGNCKPAVPVLSALEEKTAQDPRYSFSIGLSYAQCHEYDRAEKSFSAALRADPSNFDVLYNLGVAARRAGHLDRAQQMFEAALRSKPEDVDALSAYGDLLIATKDFLTASAVLYRAARLAPDRADVLLLLSHTTEELGYYEDTASTLEKYLKLRPADEVARRELGFSLILEGRFEEGLPKLQQFVLRHPHDARGQYELGAGEATGSPEKALTHLDEALKLDPTMFEARYTRAALNFQNSRLDQSLADFEALRKIDPDNPRILDWQGQIYLRRGQPQEAAMLLQQAVKLDPHDRAILIHYSQALEKLGRTNERHAVLASFKEAAAGGAHPRARSGLLDFLALSPEQQGAKYLESLQAAVNENPNDVALKARLADYLLNQGEEKRAAAVFREVLAAGPDTATLADCGKALLEHEQYGLAVEFLQKAPNAKLDLAIAVFHSVSPEAGLAQLDAMPADQRAGDYFILRAQILDSMGKTAEAVDSLDQGIRAAPRRADMYFEAAAFLIQHGRFKQAAALLEDATRLIPDAPNLWLARVIALELPMAHGRSPADQVRSEEAMKVLAQIESRWPAWDLPYLVNGMILQDELKSKPAKQMLDLAIALGCREVDAYYYEALAITNTTPVNLAEAEKAISQAVTLNPEHAPSRALAGQILLDKGDYQAAVEQLLAAVRVRPTLYLAHGLLRTAYLKMGESDKAAEELNQMMRLTKPSSETDQATSSMERLLFTVRVPGGTSLTESKF